MERQRTINGVQFPGGGMSIPTNTDGFVVKSLQFLPPANCNLFAGERNNVLRRKP